MNLQNSFDLKVAEKEILPAIKAGVRPFVRKVA